MVGCLMSALRNLFAQKAEMLTVLMLVSYVILLYILLYDLLKDIQPLDKSC